LSSLLGTLVVIGSKYSNNIKYINFKFKKITVKTWKIELRGDPKGRLILHGVQQARQEVTVNPELEMGRKYQSRG